MKEHRIISVETKDVRFPLHKGAGSDAVHSGSEYAFATTLLASSEGLYGTGIVLTLGEGNQLVCQAVELLGKSLIGQEIEELMASFGAVTQRLAQDPQLRWLGPQKGVVHLALASLTNACFEGQGSRRTSVAAAS
jgi:L-fuconate dehydratase